MSLRAVCAAAVIVACAARVAPAQSLGELAKREEERRKALRASGKVYTNDTVGSQGQTKPSAAATTPPAPSTPAASASGTSSSPSGAPPAAGSPASTTPGTSPAAGDKTAPDDKSKAAADPKKDEAMWRERITAARDALQRAQLFADALQSRINGLSADFAARDDPAQRSTLATDRQKALAELDRVKKEIDQNTKTITAIQEDARKAGVPPGWLR